MTLSMPAKIFTLALAFGVFGFVGSANADDRRDVITGIIGEAIAGAADSDDDGDDAEDPRCEAWENRCDSGHQPSCALADANCDDDDDEGPED
ncbi:MAG: hypothetical protein ACFCUR_21720 [Rhodomicrobiaceae bacterium]